MNTDLSHKFSFPDFYLPENRLKVNSWCYFAASMILCFGLGISYLLITSTNEQSEIILLVLMGYSGLSFVRMCFYIGGSVKYAKLSKEALPIESMQDFPFISILVPAYNEGAVIAEVIRNYSVINYPFFEIIIVDDGSKDDTYEAALAGASKVDLNILVFRKENGGKASALNFALEKAKGEFVLCMDADSKLAPDTLKYGVRHFFNNPNLAAVAGMVKVENTDSLIGRMQYLDYLFGHFQKKSLSVLKAVTIVPGPIGLFRKSDIEFLGGYERENTTYAEDTELTFKLLIQGKEIICEDGMISYTEAPANYVDLYRQRYRWTRGIFQALIKNAQGFLQSDNPRSQVIFIFLLWEQIIFPIIDFTLLLVFIFCYFFTPIEAVASFLLLYVYAIDLIMAVMATKHEKRKLNWIYQSVLSRFFYSNILLVWKLSAFYDEWIARGMSWDKLVRNGFSKSCSEA
ncbi:MAG: glycosyltransferase [Bacteriovoracaceae bacterium]|nr:glycosyltransferase [Bacteriovoracaceae bacterium]